MKLPSKVTVGETAYTVEQPETILGCRGDINYTHKKIRVARQTSYERSVRGTHSIGMRVMPEDIRANTFWHELTHAILWDMGDRKATNEIFVTRFANRLADAIASVEFEDQK